MPKRVHDKATKIVFVKTVYSTLKKEMCKGFNKMWTIRNLCPLRAGGEYEGSPCVVISFASSEKKSSSSQTVSSFNVVNSTTTNFPRNKLINGH